MKGYEGVLYPVTGGRHKHGFKVVSYPEGALAPLQQDWRNGFRFRLWCTLRVYPVVCELLELREIVCQHFGGGVVVVKG